MMGLDGSKAGVQCGSARSRVACILTMKHYIIGTSTSFSIKRLANNSGLVQPILLAIAAGTPLTDAQWQLLWAEDGGERRRALAWGDVPAQGPGRLAARAQWLQQVYPDFVAWCDRRLGHPAEFLGPLWSVWLPLAERLVQLRQTVQRPIVQGLLGGQGTGKTTLGEILTLLLRHRGYSTLSLSLDDLYKTYGDRQVLQTQEPRLIWRGPPGTHDVALGVQVLDQLRHPQPGHAIAIPRFDKSLHQGQGDRTTADWVADIDIVLFEGWFVGVCPVPPQTFDQPPPPIVTEGDRAFAVAMNQRLHAYLPLWERLDALWILHVTDYRLSKEWRKQAEREMQARGKPGMTDEQIDAFVDYFWQALHPALFIPPLLAQADLVIEVCPNHALGAVYAGLGWLGRHGDDQPGQIVPEF